MVSILLALALLMSAQGCASMDLPASTAPHAPVLIHASGISGPTIMDRAWLEGLHDGGLDADMELFDWTGADPGLASLRAVDRNHDAAQKLADRLTQLARTQPEHPIVLSGNSAGVGVAVWALEKLPDDVSVQTVILTAPAISPEYDLTAALRHVRGKCIAFTSMGDALICGLGTSMFGTVDRVNGDAAGRVGFRQPSSADSQEYAKLAVYSYQSQWLRWGDFGGHTGSMTPPFAKNFIAPLLLEDLSHAPSIR